jgi:mono/diheme cytochrome c family protein
MKYTPAILTLAASLCASALLGPPTLAAQGNGAYTAAQAADGAAIFATKCSVCHGAQLQGKVGPALAGPSFIASYEGQTADDVRDFIATAMPLTAPGSLKPNEVLAVLSFILQKNRYDAGNIPLTEPTSKTIKIATQN